METAGFELQVLVLATRVKGELTCAPFAGVVTVMACAGVTIANSAKTERKNLFMVQPRMKMGQRVPVNPGSGLRHRCEKHVNHGCHCSEHNPYKSLRGLFSYRQFVS